MSVSRPLAFTSIDPLASNTPVPAFKIKFVEPCRSAALPRSVISPPLLSINALPPDLTLNADVVSIVAFPDFTSKAEAVIVELPPDLAVNADVVSIIVFPDFKLSAEPV